MDQPNENPGRPQNTDGKVGKREERGMVSGSKYLLSPLTGDDPLHLPINSKEKVSNGSSSPWRSEEQESILQHPGRSALNGRNDAERHLMTEENPPQKPNPLAQFTVGHDDSLAKIPVLLVRPSNPSEKVLVTGLEIKSEEKISVASSTFSANVTSTGASSEADLSQLSTRDLMLRLMPYEAEALANTFKDQYSMLLKDVAEDAFVSCKTDNAYKELLNRYRPDDIDYVLMKEYFEIFKRSASKNLQKSQIIGYLSKPAVRQEVVLQLAKFTLTEELAQKLDRDCDFGQFEWQKEFCLASKTHRWSVVNFLRENHENVLVELISDDSLIEAFVKTHGFEEADIFHSSLNEYRMYTIVDTHRAKIEELFKKYNLLDEKELLFRAMKDEISNDYLRYRVTSNYRDYKDPSFTEVVESWVKQGSENSTKEQELSQKLIQIDIMTFISEIVAVGIKNEALLHRKLGEFGSDLLATCRADYFFEFFLKKLPFGVLNTLKSKFLTVQDCTWALLQLEETKFGSFLELLSPENFSEITIKCLPFEALIESSLKEIEAAPLKSELLKQEKSGFCCTKKDKAKETVYLQEGEFEEEITEKCEGNKLEKLVEADPAILKDFWHQGPPTDRLSSFTSSSFMGFNGRCVNIENTSYQMILMSNHERDYASHAVLFDYKANKQIAILPGVFLVGQYFFGKELFCLRLINPLNSTDECALQIELVWYELQEEPPRLVEKSKQVMRTLKSTLREVRFFATYSSTCAMNRTSTFFIYCNDEGYCRTILNTSKDSDIQENKDVACQIKFPEEFKKSKQCNLYFTNYGNNFVVVDRLLKKISVMNVEIGKDYQEPIQVSCTVLRQFDIPSDSTASGLSDVDYSTTTRDASATTYLKRPLPFYDGDKVYEFEGERQFIELKQVLQVKGKIKSLTYSRNYIFLVVLNQKTNKDSLCVYKKTDKDPVMVWNIEAVNYKAIRYTEDCFVVDTSESKQIGQTQVANMPIERKKIGYDWIRFDVVGFNKVKYAGFPNIGGGAFLVKNRRDHSTLASFDLNSISKAYEGDLSFNNAILSSDLSKAAFFSIKRSGIDNDWLVFGADLTSGSFFRYDLTLNSVRSFKASGSHLAYEDKDDLKVYYLDEFGRLLLVGKFPKSNTEDLNFSTANQSWVRQIEHVGFVGYKEHLIDQGPALKEVKLCSQPYTESKFGVFDSSYIYQYDLEEFYCQERDVQLDVRRKGLWSGRHFFKGIEKMCMHPKGTLCYAIIFDQSFALYKIILVDLKVDSKKVADLSFRNPDPNLLTVNFSKDCSYVVVKYKTPEDTSILVFGTKHDDLLYSISDVDHYFVRDLKLIEVDCDLNSLSMHNLSGSSVQKILSCNHNPFLTRQILGVFRFSLFNYMYSHERSNEERKNTFEQLKSFIESINPIYLLQEKGIFLALAYMKTTEILDVYIKHCTLRRMVLYGQLLEWLFAEEKQRKRLRLQLLSHFDEILFTKDDDVDGLDPCLLDKLILYRHTARLLREPTGRGIFLRLLRVPLVRGQGDSMFQPSVEADDGEIDEDFDTGHLVDVGSDRFLYGMKVYREVLRLKKRTSKIKGNNLVPFQIYISATPVELTFGSQLCTELFILLDQCPSEELNELLRPFIYLNWSNIFPITVSYMLAYWAFAGICYAFYGFQQKSLGLGIAVICFSVLFLVYELLNWKSNGRNYLQSPWNWLDFCCLLGCIVTVPMLWHFDVETRGWAAGRCVIVTIVWFRAITWLKIFRSVRYLISMILRVFYDMIAFLTILTGCIFGLAFIWRLAAYFGPDEDPDVTGRETLELVPSFFSSLQVVTFIILGNMPATEGDGREFSVVKFLVAVAFGIILALALTNFLIAIIGSTYSTFEDTKKLHDLREVIGLIVEFNGTAGSLCRCLMSRRRFVLSIHKRTNEEADVNLFDQIAALIEDKFASLDDKLTNFDEKFASLEENIKQIAEIKEQNAEQKALIENLMSLVKTAASSK
jgi:hypothetical protein